LFLFICGAIELGSRALFPQPPVNATFADLTAILEDAQFTEFSSLLARHPTLFWTLRPNLAPTTIKGRNAGNTLQMTIRSNALGFRGADWIVPENHTHVLAIGDSCTFGYGVAEEESWPARAELNLRQKKPAEWTVTNAGMPGYTFYQGMQFLEEIGFDLKPDLIVASFGPNDVQYWNSRSDIDNARRIAQSRRPNVLQELRTYQLMVDLSARMNAAARRLVWAHQRLSAEEVRSIITTMHEACLQRQVPLVLFIWPWRDQVDGESEPMGHQEVILHTARARNIPCIDFTPILKSESGNHFLDDLHGTPDALVIAAREIQQVILQELAQSP
jgi:lysophospholipase L1-like esterase